MLKSSDPEFSFSTSSKSTAADTSFSTSSKSTAADISFFNINLNYNSDNTDNNMSTFSVIRESILNESITYTNILDYIENILNILVYYENINDAEIQYIEKFKMSNIVNINNIINSLELNFNEIMEIQKSSIVFEDNIYIANFIKMIKKLYSMVNLCSLLAIKINDKHKLQKNVDDISIIYELLQDLNKLQDYLKSKLLNQSLTEVEQLLDTTLKLKEPYNTYVSIYGIPDNGLFEASKLNDIQTYLNNGLTSEEIKINMI